MEKQNEESRVLTVIEEAVQELYANDRDMIVCNVGEWAIAFRLGIYLNKQLKNYFCGYHLDAEYNKSKTNPKTVYAECGNGACNAICEWHSVAKTQKTARPDFILHRRGENDNLCYIEVKKMNNRRIDRDIHKLSYFTCEKGAYGYKYGILLRLGKEKATVTLFRNGKSVRADMPIEIPCLNYWNSNEA